MPTDRAPDPIGQQFMRQMQSPMGQQFQAQYEATQAPIREAEMAQRAEEQAAQDTRFQEMMDRIAELEGQLAQPEPMPEPSPYIPGQTPFPGIPDFIRDLDFSGLPDFNIDYDDLMDQYRDRETDTRNDAQRRIDAIRQNRERKGPPTGSGFIPEAIRDVMERIEMPRDLPPVYAGGTPGFDMTRELTNDPNYIPPRDAGAMPPENNFFVDGDGNLNVGDGIIRPMGMPPGPAPGPIFQQSAGNNPHKINELGLEKAIADMGAVRKKMPELPDFNFNTSNIPSVDESVATSFMPGSGMGRIGQGVATDRESLIGKKIFGQTITPESFAGRETARSPFLRATPRPDLPTPNISGPFGFIKNSPSIDERPMIPNFGNIKAFLR